MRGAWETGELVGIGFAVLEPSHRLIPYLVEAMREVAEAGLGRDRVEVEILGMWAVAPDGGEIPIWRPGEGMLPLAQIPVLGLDSLPPLSGAPLEAVTVRFLTPACLIAKGKLLEELPFSDVARALVRRLRGLRALAGTAVADPGPPDWLEEAGVVETVETALTPMRLVRYQQREERVYPVPALQGHVSYRGEPLQHFEPVLRLGQALLVGKKTSFGCGGYVSRPFA